MEMLDSTKRRRVKKKTPKKGMSITDQISRMFSTERNKKRRGISTPMDAGEFSFSPKRRNKATGDLSVRPGGERGTFKSIFEQKRIADAAKKRLSKKKDVKKSRNKATGDLSTKPAGEGRTFKTIFEQKRMADAAKRRLQSAKAKKQMISKGSSPQGRGFVKKKTTKTPMDAGEFAFTPKVSKKTKRLTQAEAARKRKNLLRPLTSTSMSSAALAKAFKESEAKRPAQSKAKNFNVGVSKGGVSFKEAFKHFKNKGQKVFTWNGKKYTTELAKSSKKVKVASPQSRPSTPKKEVVKRKVGTTESPKGGMMKKKKVDGKKKPKASPKQGRFGKVPPKMSLSYAEKNYAPFKNKLKSGHVIRTINGKRFQVPIADAKKTR
tara:strand:- start:188 stop:1321 length:1134 start_codon:yes stop_codon:yes gene_type:complete